MEEFDHCGAAKNRFHQLAVALEYPGRGTENTGQNFYPYRTSFVFNGGRRKGVPLMRWLRDTHYKPFFRKECGYRTFRLMVVAHFVCGESLRMLFALVHVNGGWEVGVLRCCNRCRCHEHDNKVQTFSILPEAEQRNGFHNRHASACPFALTH